MTTVAIIGLGAVTRNIHMPAYSQLGNRARVVAGCDSNAAARDSYLTHAEHEKFKANAMPVVESVVIFDFEV